MHRDQKKWEVVSAAVSEQMFQVMEPGWFSAMRVMPLEIKFTWELSVLGFAISACVLSTFPVT